ncbi:MAG: hypothetical protein AAGM33_12240 [Pseudomonadota bacterium]
MILLRTENFHRLQAGYNLADFLITLRLDQNLRILPFQDFQAALFQFREPLLQSPVPFLNICFKFRTLKTQGLQFQNPFIFLPLLRERG